MTSVDQDRAYKTEVEYVRFGRKATKQLISRDSAVGYKRQFDAS